MGHLDAGELTVFLEFGCNLKDKDWLGRQDPYVILSCGAQKYRSQTHVDGGRNPVWNQQFRFNVINENDVSLTVMEQDVMLRDELIGSGLISLARVRTTGSDRQQVHLTTRRGKLRGFVQVNLTFVRNHAFAGIPAPQPTPYSYGYSPAPLPSAPPAYGGYAAAPAHAVVPTSYGYAQPAPTAAYHPQPVYAQPLPATAPAAYPTLLPAPHPQPAPVMMYPPPTAPGMYAPAAYPMVPSPYHLGPRSITSS